MTHANSPIWLSVIAAVLLLVLLVPIAAAAPPTPPANVQPAQNATSSPEPKWELPSNIPPYHTLRVEAALTDAIESDPTNWQALAQRAKLYQANGALRLALEDVNAALALEPADTGLLLLRARIQIGTFLPEIMPELMAGYTLPEYDQHWNAAQLDIDAVLADDPKNVEANVVWGLLAAAQRDYPLAEAKFSRAIELDPANGLAYYYRGFAHIQDLLNDRLPIYYRYYEVLDVPDLKTAADMLPNQPEGLFAHAWWEFITNDDLDAAAALWREGSRLYPNNAPYYVQLALFAESIYRPSDELDELEADLFASAAITAPFSPLYHLMRGVNQRRLDPSLAELYFEDALEQEPDYYAALVLLTDLSLTHELRDCDQAGRYMVRIRSLLEDHPIDISPVIGLDARHAQLCEAPTAIPTSQAVSDPRFPPGTIITVRGFAGLTLGSAPAVADAALICVAGETPTVLQTVEVGGIRYVELQCEAGIGWIAEAFIK